MMRVVIAAALLLSACARAPESPEASAKPRPARVFPSPYTAEFWKIWGDGQAEMNGYDLTYPKYGQSRKGVAVAIFVTETFSNSLRVKSEPGRRGPADEFPVMKLNLIRDYQTGIYDYNDMLSTFIALVPVNGQRYGQPTKVSFSSQEWCGHVYSQLLFGNLRAHQVSHSYFDGEADSTREFRTEPRTTSEDALLLWARTIGWPIMKDGSTTVMMLSSLETSRAKHEPLTLARAELSVDPKIRQIRVPAGAFDVELRTAKLHDGTWHRFYVEKAVPRRVIKWETSNGALAELLGSDRMKYWEMNREGGEQALQRIGLSRRGIRMP
jgi:hypothetical protein